MVTNNPSIEEDVACTVRPTPVADNAFLAASGHFARPGLTSRGISGMARTEAMAQR